MKITLDIPDTIICGILNCVIVQEAGMALMSCQLGSDDLKDGNTIKLPREVNDHA